MPVCAEEETVTMTQTFASCKNNLRNQEQEHTDFVKPLSPLYTKAASLLSACLLPSRLASNCASQPPQLPTKPRLPPPETLLPTPLCPFMELRCMVPLFQYVCYCFDIFCSYRWSTDPRRWTSAADISRCTVCLHLAPLKSSSPEKAVSSTRHR